jgi:hypothetical protein
MYGTRKKYQVSLRHDTFFPSFKIMSFVTESSRENNILTLIPYFLPGPSRKEGKIKTKEITKIITSYTTIAPQPNIQDIIPPFFSAVELNDSRKPPPLPSSHPLLIIEVIEKSLRPNLLQNCDAPDPNLHL